MPPGIDLGPLGSVTYYGIIVMTGALVAVAFCLYEAKRRGMDTDIIWDGFIWILIAGVVGARIWHILTPPESMAAEGLTTWYYLTHPLDAINIRKGGLGIPGAVIAGGLALYVFTRRRGVSFSQWADLAAPAVALAQAIGRWGNFVNQELYGAPTNLPWALYIDPEHRLPDFQSVEYYHPLFLYESLWNLANFLLLYLLSRRFGDRLRPGDIFLTYLTTYPIGRFLLEFIRLDASQVAGINANQATMALVAISAALLLVIRHRQGASPAPPATQA